MKDRYLKEINMCGKGYSLNSIQVEKSSIHGNGVFTNKEYQVGSEVAYFEGYKIDHDTRHSLTLDGQKIEPTGVLKYLNHSCNPNSYFHRRTLVTKRQVKPGEELTINYSDTEDNITYCFKCNCRTDPCRKSIQS